MPIHNAVTVAEKSSSSKPLMIVFRVRTTSEFPNKKSSNSHDMPLRTRERMFV